MVKLNKIYTKTGDDGSTGLGDGKRRKKSDARIAAYGMVDEIGAAIGVVRALQPNNQQLAKIQNDLFDIGADLCVVGMAEKNEAGRSILRLQESQIASLEKAIDEINLQLEPLKSFILCGGNEISAALHVARVVARRAERSIVALAEIETINRNCLIYINRLSDYLFVAARFANNRGKDDILWVPRGNIKG